MNKLEEYKNRIQWDIWEDIQRVKENAEEYCTNSSQRTNNVQSLKRYKKT